MKNAERKPADELRPEYRRSDFRALVRGKYAHRAVEASNVVVLEPQVARAFPNDRAANAALRGILRACKRGGRPAARTIGAPRERP
jgi:hypothetical protein